MTGQQTLESWLTHLENRHRHAPIQLGLARVQDIAAQLDVLHFSCPVVLVGGTNGKGSTVTALETLYLAAGYRVGSYLSPHVIDFTERVRWGGQPISEETLIMAFERVAQCAKEADLTYFEFITLAALWFFKQQAPEVLVLEVGMGGRLDATNLLNADLAIITTVDFDHEAYLGSTLEAIGAEKAGILRAGKAFIMASPWAPESVRQKAQACAQAIYFNEDYTLQDKGERVSWTFGKKHLCLPRPHLNLHAVGAAWVASILGEKVLPVSVEALQSMASVRLRGRLQQISTKQGDVWLDVAHNPQSMRYLAAWLAREISPCPVRVVFSALQDKNIPQMVDVLSPYISVWYVAPLVSERAATLPCLQTHFAAFPFLSVLWYNTLSSAFMAAQRHRQPGEVVLVCGSFLTVSAILRGACYVHDE